MSLTNINRNLTVQLFIWLGILISVFTLLLISMPAQYAGIRAAVITSGLMLIHYLNVIVFNRYIPSKHTNTYIIWVIAFTVIVSMGRYILEDYILPRGTQPFYIQIRHAGPVFFIFSTGIPWFVSTVILYALYYSEREKIMLKIINANNEAKLQYLQTQINPHFLFNALNNIYSLALTKSAQTPEMLLTLTEMLRYSVYQKAKGKVALSHEAEQINFLITLFNLKTDEPFNIVLEKKGTAGYIEPMILVPLAENCLKHCDFDLNENAFAKMTLDVSETTIRFTTENTFSNNEIPGTTGGVGIQNIKERLELVYGSDYSFNVTQQNNIYKTELILQWNEL